MLHVHETLLVRISLFLTKDIPGVAACPTIRTLTRWGTGARSISFHFRFKIQTGKGPEQFYGVGLRFVTSKVSLDLQTSGHRSRQAIVTPVRWRVGGLGDALRLAWVTLAISSQRKRKYEKHSVPMPAHRLAPMPRWDTRCFPASIMDEQQNGGAPLGPQHPHTPPQLLSLFAAPAPVKHLCISIT